MLKFLDLSNYDIDAVQNANCLVENGFDRFIIGAQRVDAANAITTAMISAGATPLAVYCFLYFGFDVNIEVNKAIELAKSFGINWIAMDVESTAADENGIQAPSDRLRDLRVAIRTAEDAGFRVIIYTYGSYWVNQMGNSTDFSSYPLWYANYGLNDGTLPPIENANFGGWSNVSIHQFCSGVSICGRNRDQNYLIDENLFEEEDMTKLEELNAAIQKRLEIISIASGEYTLMLKAYDLLKSAGIIL